MIFTCRLVGAKPREEQTEIFKWRIVSLDNDWPSLLIQEDTTIIEQAPCCRRTYHVSLAPASARMQQSLSPSVSPHRQRQTRRSKSVAVHSVPPLFLLRQGWSLVTSLYTHVWGTEENLDRHTQTDLWVLVFKTTCWTLFSGSLTCLSVQASYPICVSIYCWLFLQVM